MRVEIGKDVVSVEFFVDQMGSLTPWQSRTMSHYGRYMCKSLCSSWKQVIAHTEREGYINPHTHYGRRWSVVKVRVSVDNLVPFRVEEVRADDSSIVRQNISSAPEKADTDRGVV